jgi:hypothetical protein
MIDTAQKLSGQLGVLNNSFLSGKGNFVGFLGEEVFLKGYGGSRVGKYNFDLMYNCRRIEVKTKKTAVQPRPHYMCSVSTFNAGQRADYYAFCRVDLEKNIGWICGFYPVNKFKIDAKYYKAGDYDPDNDYYVRSNCWSLPISKLQEEI